MVSRWTVGCRGKSKDDVMRCKTLSVKEGERLGIDRFPNFSVTGSIRGMKKLYYGKNALLVRCGSWIYNVTREPEIYNRAY